MKFTTKCLLLTLLMLTIAIAQLANCSDPVDGVCSDECLIGDGPDNNQKCYPKVTNGKDCPLLDENACQVNQAIEQPICLWGQAPKSSKKDDDDDEQVEMGDGSEEEEEEEDNYDIDMINKEDMDKLFKEEFDDFNQDFMTDTDSFAAKPTCYEKVDQDNCEAEYATELECKQSETLKCIYKKGCITITDFTGLKCQEKFSQLACKYVTEEPCTYKEGDSKCDTYDKNTMKSCDEAMNRVACEDTHESIQCMWKEEEQDQSQSKCVSYRPDVCEGDNGRKPLRYICDQIDLKCKWHEEKGECLTLEDSEGCTDESKTYIRNKFGCIEMNEDCKWIEEEKDVHKKCLVYEFDNLDKECEDGRNKYSCRKSIHKCAFGNRCETFNNYTHNCDDDLSYKACRLVPFPCGWKDEECSWFDDTQHKCKHASNEVACLISDQKCIWYPDENDELNSNCEEDQSLHAVDSFWASWDENDFNEDFIKKFFEEQLSHHLSYFIQQREITK